jgi:hypothetical protein
MSKKGRRASGLAVLASAILFAAIRADAAAPRTLTAWDARAVKTARAGAVKRLASAECRKVFTDFKDAEGRTLQQNLEERGESPAEYIGLIPFVDGSSHPLCLNTRVAMVTNPGGRRVLVCKSFAEFALKEPHLAESMLIHEILHTLGLGESPQRGAPSSLEITQRIQARCR